MGDAILYAGAVLLPLVFAGALYVLRGYLTSEARRGRLVRLIVGNFLVLGFMLSLAFLSLECYFRYWFDATDSFSQTRVSARWYERHYVRNNAEFRDNIDYYFPRRPGKR